MHMPIFEYHCSDCERDFEAFVTADRKAECPSCQGSHLVKQLSSPGMVGASNGARRRRCRWAADAAPAAPTALPLRAELNTR
jgi:putative FmdB family regulatory protein